MKHKDYYKKNKERETEMMKKWSTKNQDKMKSYAKKYRDKNRMECFIFYGGLKPKCACCGELEIKFLCLDHIDGGGNEHRKKIGRGSTMYLWIKKNNFPSIFQILCHNCNLAKGFYGRCPHKK